MPGMYSLPNHRSGVEAMYVLEGEGYETPTRGVKLRKGETVALPGDTPMRARVSSGKWCAQPRQVARVSPGKECAKPG